MVGGHGAGGEIEGNQMGRGSRGKEGQMVLAGGSGVAGGWHGTGVQDGRQPGVRSGTKG